jgi:hypothetical protein
MKNINIPGYEHYLITKDGRIFNTISQRGILKNPRELKSYINKGSGYFMAVIRSKYKSKSVYIHRLVAGAYLEKPSDKHIEVNHKNLDKQDNRIENLEWVTRDENRNHAKAVYGSGADNFIKNLLKNERLVNVGIKVYKMTHMKKDVSDIWGCTTKIVSKVFKILNVENRTSGNRAVPPTLKENLKFDIKNKILGNKANSTNIIFSKQFIEYLTRKYDKKFHKSVLYALKDEVLNEMNRKRNKNK